MIATLEAPTIDLSQHPIPTLRERLIGAVARFPFASITEIDSGGLRRSVLIQQLWRQAGAIAQELQRRSVDPAYPLILCFERSQDLIAAAWATVLLERDAYLWQFQLEGATEADLHLRSQRVGSSLGAGLLITRASLATHPQLQSLQTEADALIIDQLPMPQPTDWVGLASSRKASFFLDTSGTTGLPKIGVLSHHALSERAHLKQEPNPTSSRLSPLSFDSISGLASLLPARNRLFLFNPLRFTKDPWAYLQMAADYQVENLVLSSSFAAHLLRQGERPPLEGTLKALKAVSLGLEQIVSETIWDIMDLMDTLAGHPVSMSIGYGMTETGLLSATEVAAPVKLLPPRGSLRATPVGACMKGKRIQIVDAAGSPIECGQAGAVEAQVQMGLLSGYLLEDGTFAELEFRDGWFSTGDLGMIDGQQLTILGRAKAVIVHAGRNIPLASIDMALHRVDGLPSGPIAAVNLPDPATRTDRLVIAYAADGKRDSDLESRLIQAAGFAAKMPVAGVCPLRSSDFPYTTNGKLKREQLTERVRELLVLSEARSAGMGVETPRPSPPIAVSLSDQVATLCAVWQACLPGDLPIHRETHFFEAGGDSMAASIMLAKLEHLFHKYVPLRVFYENPTIGGLLSALGQAAPFEPDFALTSYTRLLDLQRDLIRKWPGTLPFPESLVRCFNPKGRQVPLVWVFQGGFEAQALAKALGPDVPVLAFRSWHQLVEIPALETPLVASLVDQMLLEVLAVLPRGPIVVGGNCQGGLPALSLSRQLSRLGRSPRQLVLSEWSFAARAYPHPVHLIYGSESPVARAFETENGAGWREIFAKVTTERLTIAHGDFFQPGNVEKMAAALRPFLRRPIWSKPWG